MGTITRLATALACLLVVSLAPNSADAKALGKGKSAPSVSLSKKHLLVGQRLSVRIDRRVDRIRVRWGDGRGTIRRRAREVSHRYTSRGNYNVHIRIGKRRYTRKVQVRQREKKHPLTPTLKVEPAPPETPGIWSAALWDGDDKRVRVGDTPPGLVGLRDDPVRGYWTVTADRTARLTRVANAGQGMQGQQVGDTLQASFTDVVDVAAGWNTVAFLRRDGTVWVEGDGRWGQLGDGGTFDEGRWSDTPVQVKGLASVVQIATDGKTVMALRADGTLWGWGDGHFIFLGNHASQPWKQSEPTSTPYRFGAPARATQTKSSVMSGRSRSPEREPLMRSGGMEPSG